MKANITYSIFMDIRNAHPVFIFLYEGEDDKEMVHFELSENTLTKHVSDQRFDYDMTLEMAKDEAYENLTYFMGDRNSVQEGAKIWAEATAKGEPHPEYGMELCNYFDDFDNFLAGNWAIKMVWAKETIA